MRWPLIILIIGIALAAAGLYVGIAKEEWAIASLLLVVGIAGGSAGFMTRSTE